MGQITDYIDIGGFRQARAHDYRLSLKVGINGISYLISDEQDRAIVFKHGVSEDKDRSAALKSFFTLDDKLQARYKSIRVGFDSKAFTLLPSRLFVEEDMPLYLSKTVGLPPEQIHAGFDKIPFNNSVNVYQTDPLLLSVVKNFFPDGKIYHLSSALLQGWYRQSQVTGGKKVFIDIEGRFCVIAFFDETELILANRFEFKTSGDLLYFTLMIFDKFDLNPGQVPLILSGEILEGSEVYKKLYAYVRYLRFMPVSPSLVFEGKFKELKHHHNFSLYSLGLCE